MIIKYQGESELAFLVRKFTDFDQKAREVMKPGHENEILEGLEITRRKTGAIFLGALLTMCLFCCSGCFSDNTATTSESPQEEAVGINAGVGTTADEKEVIEPVEDFVFENIAYTVDGTGLLTVTGTITNNTTENYAEIYLTGDIASFDGYGDEQIEENSFSVNEQFCFNTYYASDYPYMVPVAAGESFDFAIYQTNSFENITLLADTITFSAYPSSGFTNLVFASEDDYAIKDEAHDFSAVKSAGFQGHVYAEDAVAGTIINKSDQKWSTVYITYHFYDAENEFHRIDSAKASYIKPGESASYSGSIDLYMAKTAPSYEITGVWYQPDSNEN